MTEIVFSLVLFVSVAVLALGLTAVQVRWMAARTLMEVPRADRWHRRPTPSSGGIAVFAAVAVAYCVWFRGEHVNIAIGAAALWLLGLVDDLLRLPAWVKLVGQLGVSVAVVASGVVFNATSIPGFNVLFTVLWLVGITNAFNLIDNMDGLCAGVTVIISLFRFGLLASIGSFADAHLCLLIGGAYLGFLLLNYNPARIFMGDCGSMFAGFGLAALTIASDLPHTKAFAAGIVYPVLMFLYPIFDTALVSVLRKMAGRRISVGGRDHSSHRLVSLGLTEKRVVWMLWALTATGSLAGLLVHWQPVIVIAVAGSLFASLFGLAVFLGNLPGFPTRTVDGRPAPVENRLAG